MLLLSEPRVPLRHRTQAPTGEWLRTRIAEGMTTWTCDGATGV